WRGLLQFLRHRPTSSRQLPMRQRQWEILLCLTYRGAYVSYLFVSVMMAAIKTRWSLPASGKPIRCQKYVEWMLSESVADDLLSHHHKCAPEKRIFVPGQKLELCLLKGFLLIAQFHPVTVKSSHQLLCGCVVDFP